jgi:hypothetical protein
MPISTIGNCPVSWYNGQVWIKDNHGKSNFRIWKEQKNKRFTAESAEDAEKN